MENTAECWKLNVTLRDEMEGMKDELDAAWWLLPQDIQVKHL